MRTLVAAQPDLGDPELPHWTLDPSRIGPAALRLVIAAFWLKSRIDDHFAIVDRDRQNDADPLEDDLLF